MNIHANGYRLLTEAEWEVVFLYRLVPLISDPYSRNDL